MNLSLIALLLAIGLLSGVASGLFGIGGGMLIVPGLVYLAGFSQHVATGTSLAILLPPVGLAAVVEYYRHGNVDIKAAMIVAAALFIGGWCGAVLANHVPEVQLRLAFGICVVVLGVYLIMSALRRMYWM
ncbi:sulfite exporter TauE/SafE family protein [Methylomonas albis]|uniref:Probable membrane transporter protein n=1 Tax=Methylomonas albis TaxID=1854563 RepID=A0ABR9D183_9GAMM|nr:sulfite exporter TauE/SafE family protein [Methylomonas albis]MBD9355988.1 sulfite exporter TauE/SafE family protein [Methylomonas albis]